MLHILRFFLQDAVYFIMLPFFGSCNIHILIQGVLKLKKSCAKGLKNNESCVSRSVLGSVPKQRSIWNGQLWPLFTALLGVFLLLYLLFFKVLHKN